MITDPKIRPAWQKKDGTQAGYIVSIPVHLVDEIGCKYGDRVEISVLPDKTGLILKKK